MSSLITLQRDFSRYTLIYMENHPIPQDVTGFQFKLIGDMTVKQFAYLAAGSVLAYIFFNVPLAPIIKFPIAFVCGITGVALAFLPIEGRPLDVMVVNFFRALFSPNQYVYQKVGGVLDVQLPRPQQQKQEVRTTVSQDEKLQALLHTLPSKRGSTKLDQKEMVYFQSISSLFSGNQPAQNVSQLYVAPQQSAGQSPLDEPKSPQTSKPDVDENAVKDALAKEQQMIQKEMEEIKAIKQQETKAVQPQDQTAIHQKLEELEKELQAALSQKQALEEQLLSLTKQMQTKPQQTVYTPTAPHPAGQSPLGSPQPTQNVHTVAKEEERRVGVPMTPEAPNLVTGVVKDARGNVLQNILIEIKDKDGNPVRAFKTNPLGQFASATPLPSGTFTIEFEDPKGAQKFDMVQLTTNGDVVLPLEVLSTDAREDLRKELFGG